MANQKDTQVITSNVVLTFPRLFKPEAMNEGEEEKYSVNLLIPKTDTVTIDKIKAARKAAFEAGLKNYWNGKKPKNYQEKQLVDGDEINAELIAEGRDPRPELDGHYRLNVSSKTKPGVVKPLNIKPNGKADFVEITNEDEIYSGVIAKASINFYSYDGKSYKGVTVGLNNICKVSEGDYLGGRNSAATDFAGETFDLDESGLDDMDDLL